MKCFICEGYFKFDNKIKSNICNSCSSSVDNDFTYDSEIEFEMNILKGSGRVLPVFDDSDSDDSHGF
jgi:hypothetical protein